MTSVTSRLLTVLTVTGLALAPTAAAQVSDQVQDSDQVIPDEALAAELQADFESAQAVPSPDIQVTVQEGVVSLHGSVDTLLAKERAVHRARLLKGVRSVIDLLAVAPSGIADERITHEVQAALLTDPATDAWQLDVTVADGTVTLSGEVDSYAERTLAGTVAKGVRGVRGLANQVTVGYALTRPDLEIRRDVEQRLHWDARIDDHLVDVSVDDGRVSLSGVVGSASERALTRANAWVAGVQDVRDDDLHIQWWAHDDDRRSDHRWVARTDDEVRRAVVDAMLYDPRVFSFEPEVVVDDGVVTLKGTVDSVKARRAAAEDARNTAGVHRVNNLLDVVPGDPKPSDEAVASAARDALARDVIVHDEDIAVTVDRRQVTLEGEVSSWFAREQAEDVVARLGGVTDIRNRLEVAYPIPIDTYTYHDWDPVLYGFDFDVRTIETRPDDEIREEIAQELWWSPFVDRDAVTIRVEDGVATLSGTVDSWMERDAATENAFEGGARRVVNQLVVSYAGSES